MTTLTILVIVMISGLVLARGLRVSHSPEKIYLAPRDSQEEGVPSKTFILQGDDIAVLEGGILDPEENRSMMILDPSDSGFSGIGILDPWDSCDDMFCIEDLEFHDKPQRQIVRILDPADSMAVLNPTAPVGILDP